MIDAERAFIRASLLQTREGNKARCMVCERRCAIVPNGLGWCQTRANRDGVLVTLIYGAVSSISANPIEKKPLFHFYPGTRALTAGSWSCNFGCPWCQNWHISKKLPPRTAEYVSPEKFIELVYESDCQGTSISFNEPTLSVEWSLDVFRLARRYGLYNTYVTNGYMTREALSLLIDAGLDAMNVDIKGSPNAVRKYCKGIDLEKVWLSCRLGRERGVHIEVTTLVIPEVNDDPAVLQGIAERIVSELGSQTPWHVSGYLSAYRFNAPPTPLSTLEQAWQIGKSAGLDFVYLGNVPGHRYENTTCPTCGTLLIRRAGFDVISNTIRSGCCSRCHRAIQGVW
jgi:pyruvate formate lyase activating enzyme